MKLLNINKEIKAFIFDLDGTILDSTQLWKDVDYHYLKRFNIEFKDEYTEEIKLMSFNESAKYFIDKFKIPRSEEEIKADWNEMVLEEYRDNIPCKEGVQPFLETLKKRGIKMCVATSCNKEHAIMALKRLNLYSYFSFVRTCSEAGRNKEFPDLFCQCAKLLEVNNEECFVVEDLYSALEVAKKVGFKTIGIYDDLNRNQKEEIEILCDYYIESFYDII